MSQSQIEILATNSLICKLPFHTEDKEPSELIDFFTRPDKTPQQYRILLSTSNRQENLETILTLLKQQTTDCLLNHQNQKPNQWSSLILLLGEQHDGSKVWSSPENARLVAEILKEIRVGCLKKYSDDRLEGFFAEDFQNALTSRNTILFHILKILRTKLRPEEWKYYPAAATSFWWILSQIKYPYLSDFLADVLPSSLLLTDDYTKTYKLMGLECIIHCVDNVNKAELLRNNWAMVVYDALHKLIHDKEPDVINKVASTLLRLLGIIEENPNEHSNKITKYDDTMKKILYTMDFSSDLNQKKTWIPHLIYFIKKLGHALLHWVDRISAMLLDYSTSNDPELWIAILMCVEVCIQNTWLRPNSNAFAEIILRIVFNSSVFTDDKNKDEKVCSINKTIYEKVLFCMELLSNCEDFEQTKVQLQEIFTSRQSKQLNPLFLHELDKYDLIKI